MDTQGEILEICNMQEKLEDSSRSQLGPQHRSQPLASSMPFPSEGDETEACLPKVTCAKKYGRKRLKIELPHLTSSCCFRQQTQMVPNVRTRAKLVPADSWMAALAVVSLTAISYPPPYILQLDDITGLLLLSSTSSCL